MSAVRASVDDLDWMVRTLDQRRTALVPYAPIFWNPAPSATDIHRGYLSHLLTERGAEAYRTEHSLLVAVPLGEGWLVDDMAVSNDDYATDGLEL